jgi:WD40 repeat protein
MKKAWVIILILVAADYSFSTEPPRDGNFDFDDTWIDQLVLLEKKWLVIDRTNGTATVLNEDFTVHKRLAASGAAQAVSGGGKIYLCTGNSVHIFDQKTFKTEHTIKLGEQERALSVDYHSSGIIAVGVEVKSERPQAASYGAARFYTASGKPQENIGIGFLQAPLRIIKFVSANQVITVADGEPYLWDIRTRQIAGVLHRDRDKTIVTVTRLISSGSTVYVADTAGLINEFSLSSYDTINRYPASSIIATGKDAIYDLILSDHHLFVGTHDGALLTIDRKSREILDRRTYYGSVTSLALADSQTIIPMVAGRKPVPEPTLSGTVHITFKYAKEEYYLDTHIVFKNKSTGRSNSEYVWAYTNNDEGRKILFNEGIYTVSLNSKDITLDSSEISVTRGEIITLTLIVPPKKTIPPIPQPLKLVPGIEGIKPLFMKATGRNMAAVYAAAAGPPFLAILKSGTNIPPAFVKLSDPVSTLEISDNYIVTAVELGVLVHDWNGGKQILSMNGVTAHHVAIHDEKGLIAAALNNTLSVFSAKTGSIIASGIEAGGEILSLDFDKDGNRIYMGLRDRMIKRFGVSSGIIEELGWVYVPQDSAPSAIKVLDAAILLAGYEDSTFSQIDLVNLPGNILLSHKENGAAITDIVLHRGVPHTIDSDGVILKRNIRGKADGSIRTTIGNMPSLLASGNVAVILSDSIGIINREKKLLYSIYIDAEKSWLVLPAEGRSFSANSADSVARADGKPLSAEEIEAVRNTQIPAF